MMCIDEFVNLIKEQYFDADRIEMGAETIFRSLDSFDSLTGMAILVEIKEKTGESLSDEEWKSFHTVQDIYDYVIAKQK